MAYGFRRFRASRYSRFSRYRRRTTFRRRRRYIRASKKKVYNRNFISKRLGIPTNLSVSPTVGVSQLINPAPGTTQEMILGFSLHRVENYTDYTNLYDQYKIRGVKISFIPLANITDSSTGQYSQLLYSTYDFNSMVSTPTLSLIRQNQYVKWTPYTRIHKRYFHPRFSSDDGQSVGIQNWMPVDNSNRMHYSLIISVPNIPSVGTGEAIYRIECTYYLSFRMTH